MKKWFRRVMPRFLMGLQLVAFAPGLVACSVPATSPDHEGDLGGPQ